MTLDHVRPWGREMPWTTRGCGSPLPEDPEDPEELVSPPQVLVAEDDYDFRALVRDELRREGLDVVGCASAREVVRQPQWIQAMAGDPWSLDVVVTDLRLGEIDGLALLQRVAETRVDVPVVLISGFDDGRARARARELGAAAFLDKPIAMETLRALVQQLARERRRRVHASAQQQETPMPRSRGSES